MIGKNPRGETPRIDESAFVDRSAVIIGNVTLGRNVYVGPGAVIRADEPASSITIADNCNVQDRVVIHALQKTAVKVGENTSLSHSCIVHGPCSIGRGCFIGFGSVVFRAELGDGVVVKHLCCIEGVSIPSGVAVESGGLIVKDRDAQGLAEAGDEDRKFAEGVVSANLDLTRGYKKATIERKETK